MNRSVRLQRSIQLQRDLYEHYPCLDSFANYKIEQRDNAKIVLSTYDCHVVVRNEYIVISRRPTYGKIGGSVSCAKIEEVAEGNTKWLNRFCTRKQKREAIKICRDILSKQQGVVNYTEKKGW